MTKQDDLTSVHAKGLGWFTTSYFIVATIIGGGVVAMPVTFTNTGLIAGTLLMSLTCIIFTYTAHQLGKCWIIMQDRWPVYRQSCRKPYPEMGLRSIGVKMSRFTSVCVFLNQFGLTVVYVLLSSRIFHNFVALYGVDVSACWIMVVVSICLLPATFPGTPADFWVLAAAAMATAIVAVLLLLFGVGIDTKLCTQNVNYSSFSFFTALLGLGKFMFAFSGHIVYPTAQHDMYQPRDFTKSLILGFTTSALMYMPLSVFAYVVYGDSMRDSVIDSVQTSWIRHAANLSIAFHCIFAVISTINPVNQLMEEVFNTPHEFSAKRIMVRSSVLASVAFIALTIPDFSSVMDIFGSTAIPACCVILPSMFYLWLRAAKYDVKKGVYMRPTLAEVLERTPKIELTWNVLIMALTIFGAAISLYMAIIEFTTVRFTPPCYMSALSAASDAFLGRERLNCCGKFKNISAPEASLFCQLYKI